MAFEVKKIGLAIAMSPTARALLLQSARLAKLFGAQLIMVHVGKPSKTEADGIHTLINSIDLQGITHKLVLRNGEIAAQILAFTREEEIDLLVAGALKKENLLENYIGTVARKIMRKADCSVLMIQNPGEEAKEVHNIVINAEDSSYVEQAIEAGCYIGKLEKTQWIHITRELKLLGLALAANEQCTEEEYHESKQGMVREEIEEVEKILSKIPHHHLKVNIKMLSGKAGYELARFAERKKADLLIVGAPDRKFFLLDRIFQHDLEYIFANLPCNLLVVNTKQLS